MSQFNTLTVGNIRRETEKAVSINFIVPESLKADYTYKAGQYITLKTTLYGDEVRRDYSICSSPASGELRVAIKEVDDGLFSKYANCELQEGDVLEVSKPNGRFVFEPDSERGRNVICFAAGSGITPIMSIIKTLLKEEPKSSVALVYGNKSVSKTIFYEELTSLKKAYPSRLNLQFVFSETEESGALFGRIDNANANYFLKNLPTMQADLYYVCGPEKMIYNTSDLLKAKGVDEEKIKYELFTIPLEAESDQPMLGEGQTEVTIMLDDEESTFVMDAKTSVLEAALSEDIDAPYSCQGGICSSCLARITEGEVEMRQNNILTDSEVQDGLILTCQSHPLTPKIYIDYDDI